VSGRQIPARVLRELEAERQLAERDARAHAERMSWEPPRRQPRPFDAATSARLAGYPVPRKSGYVKPYPWLA
jgi:hypothetical protein